jgi:hypothetical protein
MQRYILTSPATKGKVEAIYNSSGILHRIDFAGADLTKEQVYGYKNRIPVLSLNIYEAFQSTNVIVAEAEFEVSFEDFKREYPYKRNTHLAQKFWPKMTSGQQYKAFCAAVAYRKFLEKNTWQSPKLPEKWLKDEEYLNDWNSLK